jgi:hypothetical protein
MDRGSESGQGPGARVSDRESVFEIYRRVGGARALVGFEFFFRDPSEPVPKKVRVEHVNPDGQTLGIMDVGAKVLLDKCVFPGELVVGTGTRSETDPVIKLLRQVRIDPQPFLDPELRVTQSEAEEFRSPPSRLKNLEQLRRSAPPVFPHQIRPNMGRGVRAATPFSAGHGPPPGRGEPLVRGGRAFRPFRPLIRGIRPIQNVQVGLPERRENEAPERRRGQFQFFEGGIEGEGAGEAGAGWPERRDWVHAEQEMGRETGGRFAWGSREEPEGPARYQGRMMGQRPEGEWNWEEFENQRRRFQREPAHATFYRGDDQEENYEERARRNWGEDPVEREEE